MIIRTPFFKFLIPFLIGLTVGFLIFEGYFFKKFYPSSIPVYMYKETPASSRSVQEAQPWFSKSYSEKEIGVDLSRQKLFLFGDGIKVREISISSGKEETPTLTGEFEVIYKKQMLYSELAECWLPFWVGFKGNYGFHEVPICGQERRGEDEIGTPVSLGCVRLPIGEAEHFYHFADIHTKVKIYGQTP